MANSNLSKYYRILRPFLQKVDIYRYEKNNFGELTDKCNIVCSVMGYPYNKYLQIIRNVIKPADFTSMKNERMLILPIKSQAQNGYPEILSGDRYIVNGKRYRVIYMQDNAPLKTIIAEREDSHVANDL